jgi:hypothetical protein
MTPVSDTPKKSIPFTVGRRKKVVVPEVLMRSRLRGNDKHKVLEIIWDDATDISGEDWVEPSDVESVPARTLSIGYLLTESAHAYTLAALVNASHYAHGITIPKGMVVEVREL